MSDYSAEASSEDDVANDEAVDDDATDGNVAGRWR